MAFWGIEMKPGNPYRHRYDDARGRLHISQATLGSGQSTKKSITVQCNVGANSPVLLCSLLPERIESCILNLEFEEENEVIFSVIGPRSVHLTGFFLGRSSGFGHCADDSDSYGEDIAETETEQSGEVNSEDDKYESDFIDDGDPEMDHSPSPETIPQSKHRDGVEGKNSNGTRSARRLKKKYELSDSDGEGGSQKQENDKSSRTLVLDSDDDAIPASVASESKYAFKNSGSKEKFDKMMDDNMKEYVKVDVRQDICSKRKLDAISKDREPNREASHHSDALSPGKIAAENGVKTKKKKKKNKSFLQTEEKNGGDEAPAVCRSGALDNDRTDMMEEKIVNKELDVPSPLSHDDNAKMKKKKDRTLNSEIVPLTEPKVKVYNDESKPQTDDQEPTAKLLNKEVTDSMALSDTTGEEKKKKGRAKDKTLQPKLGPSSEIEVETRGHDHNKQLNSGALTEGMDLDALVDTQNRKANLSDDKGLDDISHLVGSDSQNTRKKKKKRSKLHQCDMSVNADDSDPLVVEAKSQLTEKMGNQNDQVPSLKTRSFSNGLIIEELSTGESDGKKAELGKKVSVHYIGRLKDSGEVFFTTAGRKPFKFRLGKGEIFEGLETGVAGMHVGDKRRLTVPPSLGYGEQGEGDVPANAWLVFDVELVDVH